MGKRLSVNAEKIKEVFDRFGVKEYITVGEYGLYDGDGDDTMLVAMIVLVNERKSKVNLQDFRRGSMRISYIENTKVTNFKNAVSDELLGTALTSLTLTRL